MADSNSAGPPSAPPDRALQAPGLLVELEEVGNFSHISLFLEIKAKERQRCLRFQIGVFAAAIFAFAFERAWAWSDMKPNIILACFCWAIVVASGLTLLWQLPITNKWTRTAKILVNIGVPLALILIFRDWAVTSYKIQRSAKEVSAIDSVVVMAITNLTSALERGNSQVPRFDVFINDESHPLKAIDKLEGEAAQRFKFRIVNNGQHAAEHLTVTFHAPNGYDIANANKSQWTIGLPPRNTQLNRDIDMTTLRISARDIIMVGDAWITPPIVIPNSGPAPEFTTSQMRELGFSLKPETPNEQKFHFIPCQLNVGSSIGKVQRFGLVLGYTKPP